MRLPSPLKLGLLVLVAGAWLAENPPTALAQPTVVATIQMGWGAQNLRAVAVNPSTNRVYTTDVGSNRVSAIDGGTNTVLATIAAGSGPLALAPTRLPAS